MRQRSWLGPWGLALGALLGACANETGFTVVMDGNFAAPVAEFDPALDVALWDDTNYDAVVVTGAVAQVSGVVVPASQRLPRPVGSLLAGLGVAIPSSCVPVVTVTDNDQDGIPAFYSATFNCVGTSRVTGRIAIADTNDNSATGGLTVTFTNFVIGTVSSGGILLARTFNGSMSLTPQSGGTFLVQQDLTVTFPSADPATPLLLSTYASKENATYTPDAGTVDPFSSGTAHLSGSGKMTSTFNGQEEKRDISRDSNPDMHWNRACRTQFRGSVGYDSGNVIYSISGDGKLQLIFSGCVAPTRAITQNN